MKTDVLIVGGGLSGLSLAWRLEQRGLDYHLVEARDRLGGRILTETVSADGNTGHFDLGPAWFWPGQPRMTALLDRLGLAAFDQQSAGELTYEDERGRVSRGQGFASMAGSYRIVGGMGALIGALRSQLPDNRIQLGRSVVRMSEDSGSVVSEIENSGGTMQTMTSHQAVLAIPPRVAADRVRFTNGVSSRALDAMKQIPTWMACHAKIVAVFDRPFWRDAGLSGDAMSRRGPMVEIHDASPASGGPYALFGFVGVPPRGRKEHGDWLVDLAQAQLGRLYGDAANRPIKTFLQDWAFEPETATSLDLAPLYHHPNYGLPRALANLWDGRLIMGSTEIARQFGGYLEGALEASEIALGEIDNKRARLPTPADPIEPRLTQAV